MANDKNSCIKVSYGELRSYSDRFEWLAIGEIIFRMFKMVPPFIQFIVELLNSSQKKTMSVVSR